MKRTYSDLSVTLSVLPPMTEKSSEMFKSTLPSSYKLQVTKVVDISKPVQRPVDEIEEPEEEDIANANRLNKGNARMIQLDLKDANGQNIRALETERIETLNEVKPNYIVNIGGPVEVRCGNIMLQKRNLLGVEIGPDNEKNEAPEQPKPQTIVSRPPQVLETQEVKHEAKHEVIQLDEDWDEEEDDDDCIIVDST